MDKKTKLNKIKNALKKTFPGTKIKEDIVKLKIGSFKKWDSLGHLNLILEVEKEFKFKFHSSVFSKIKSVQDILKQVK
jgi:acyl carrier protein